jgi:hypothetical protein
MNLSAPLPGPIAPAPARITQLPVLPCGDSCNPTHPRRLAPIPVARLRIAWSGLLLLVLLSACRSTGEPLVPDMTQQRIVFRHAESAFAVAFDASSESDRAALAQFSEAITGAMTRMELRDAWATIPDLRAQGVDFLESRIFARAARDGDWPTGEPPVDESWVYVEPVRMAIERFLTGEPEDGL